jgi:hypothetical protein
LGIAVAGGSVGTSSIRPGQSVELTASGFEPSSPVTVTLRSEPRVLGTANAAADGTFRLSVDIPSDAEPGAHRLEVSGTGADGASHVVASDITIIDTLPNTGMRRRVALTGMAVALVAFGFALVLMAGPRRRSLVGELDRVSERRGSR